MGHPDIDLHIETPPFVAQHPELAELLAGRADDRSADTPEVQALRVGVRKRVRAQLAAGRTERAQADRRAAGEAFLARYGL
jgi:hypothetical protein